MAGVISDSDFAPPPARIFHFRRELQERADDLDVSRQRRELRAGRERRSVTCSIDIDDRDYDRCIFVVIR